MPATSCSSARPSVPFPPGWAELGGSDSPEATPHRPFPPGWEEAVTVGRRAASTPSRSIGAQVSAARVGNRSGRAFPPGWQEIGGATPRTELPGWDMRGIPLWIGIGAGRAAPRTPAEPNAPDGDGAGTGPPTGDPLADGPRPAGCCGCAGVRDKAREAAEQACSRGGGTASGPFACWADSTGNMCMCSVRCHGCTEMPKYCEQKTTVGPLANCTIYGQPCAGCPEVHIDPERAKRQCELQAYTRLRLYGQPEIWFDNATCCWMAKCEYVECRPKLMPDGLSWADRLTWPQDGVNTPDGFICRRFVHKQEIIIVPGGCASDL